MPYYMVGQHPFRIKDKTNNWTFPEAAALEIRTKTNQQFDIYDNYESAFNVATYLATQLKGNVYGKYQYPIYLIEPFTNAVLDERKFAYGDEHKIEVDGYLIAQKRTKILVASFKHVLETAPEVDLTNGRTTLPSPESFKKIFSTPKPPSKAAEFDLHQLKTPELEQYAEGEKVTPFTNIASITKKAAASPTQATTKIEKSPIPIHKLPKVNAEMKKKNKLSFATLLDKKSEIAKYLAHGTAAAALGYGFKQAGLLQLSLMYAAQAGIIIPIGSLTAQIAIPAIAGVAFYLAAKTTWESLVKLGKKLNSYYTAHKNKETEKEKETVGTPALSITPAVAAPELMENLTHFATYHPLKAAQAQKTAQTVDTSSTLRCKI